jgi:hypothetical protein
MLYSEIIAACFQIHTKHINTLCGLNLEFFSVKPGGTCSTTGLWRVSIFALVLVRYPTGTLGPAIPCYRPKHYKRVVVYKVFLVEFAKLRKATISYVVSVSLHGTSRLLLDTFLWHLIFELFSKFWGENSSFIKMRKEQGYFTWRRFTFMTVSRLILLRMRNVSYKNCRDQNTHFMLNSFFFFFPENRAVCEIMSKNMVEPERLQKAVCRRVAC